MRLTDPLITNARYRGEPTTDAEGRTQWPVFVLWDDEVPGLGLRVLPPVRGRPSRKDFIVTWRTTGLKSRTMNIGTYGVDCTLRQARRTAREALDLARRGQDPIEVRQRQLGIGTPEDLASRFLFEHSSAAKKKNVPGGEPSATGPAEPAQPAEVAEGVVVPAAEDPAPEAVDVPPVAPAEGAAAASADSVTMPEVAAPAPGELPASPVPASPPRATAPAAPPSAAPPPAAPPPKVESSALPRRGPTRLRMLSVPEGLHREIEQRARAAGLTIAAYLQTLLELEASSSSAEDSAEPSERREPVDVGALLSDSFDDEPGRGGD